MSYETMLANVTEDGNVLTSKPAEATKKAKDLMKYLKAGDMKSADKTLDELDAIRNAINTAYENLKSQYDAFDRASYFTSGNIRKEIVNLEHI